MTRQERAISYIRECRDIHAHWITAQDRGLLTPEERRIGGGKTHHKKWVRRYETVLRALGDDA